MDKAHKKAERAKYAALRATSEALSAGSHDDPANVASGLFEEISKRKAESKEAQEEAEAAKTAYADATGLLHLAKSKATRAAEYAKNTRLIANSAKSEAVLARFNYMTAVG